MLYGVASAALEPIGECSTRALLTRNAAQIDRLLNEHEPREQSICGSQDELTFTLTQILPANRSGIIFILVANTSELAVKALKLVSIHLKNIHYGHTKKEEKRQEIVTCEEAHDYTTNDHWETER